MKTIYKYFSFLIAIAFMFFTINISAQSITGLSNTSYTENSPPILIDNNVVISGGNGYGGGYLLFDLTNGTVNDQLGVTSDANPNASGSISFSGAVLYLGNGTSKDVIGSIDATLNGQNGHDLKINFTSNFTNSSFENGLGGWTVGNSMIDLGVTHIAGFVTPNDPSNTPYSNNDGDSDVPVYHNYYNQITTSMYTDGTHSLRLWSNMTTSYGCDVVHGPYVYSSPFQSSTGDVIYFDWRAVNGSDAYDVFGYILNTVTGATSIILNTTGQYYYSSTNWATASVTIPSSGSYRFVFVSGTFDASCGRAAGASLYIDNVRVFGNRVNDAIVTNIARHITYKNSCGTTAATRNLTVSVLNNASGTASANSTIAINTTAPNAICKNISVNLDANGQITVSGASLDNGSTDNCALSFSVVPSTFNCSNIGVNNVVFTATDSYGTSSNCNATITVSDNVAPIVSTQNINIQLGASGTTTITASQVNNNSTDACGIASMSVSPSTFTCANVGANTVILTVTDVNGNIATNTAVVTISSAVNTSITGANIDCNGAATGSIDFSPSNGGMPYTFAWSNSSTVEDPTGLIAGAYSVTVTDNNGCTATNSITLTEPTAIVVTTAQLNVNCYGGSDGAIDINVSGGTPSYSYLWSNAAVTQDLTGLTAGTYTVSITDANGCLKTESIIVTEPPNVAPTAFNDVLEDCQAEVLNFTSAQLLANDTDPQNDPLKIDFVSQGANGVVVDNNNGTFTYTPNPGFVGTETISYVVKKDDGYTAFPGTNHYYEFVASSGISWTAANSAAQLRTYNGMQGYLVTITSASENNFAAQKLNGQGWIGASDSGAEGVWKWVTGPEAGTHFSNQQTTGSCSAITQYGVNGNYANWSYAEPNDCGSGEDYGHFLTNGQWNDYPLSTGAIAGFVVEYGGLETCIPQITATGYITITVHPKPVLSVTKADETCLNAFNGSIDLTVSSGTSPFNYAWSNSQTSEDITGLTAGTYSVVVTDAENCSASSGATILQVDNVPPQVITQDITVYLDANGTASITANDVDNGSNDACGIASMTVSPNSFDCSQTNGIIGSPSDIISQTQVTNGGGSSSHWQSWTSTIDGVLNYIQVKHSYPHTTANTTVHLSLYQGEGTSGTLIASATNTNIVNASTGNQYYTYNFSNVNITSGQQYTWRVYFTTSQNVGWISFSTSNPYSGGRGDYCCGRIVDDFMFKINATPVTSYPVTLTVTDISMNVGTGIANITVVDNIVPAAICQNLTIQLDASGNASITAAQVNNGSNDNCGISSMTINKSTFDCGDVGSNTVVLTVTDVNENISTCSSIITVEDNIAPNAICQSITVQLDASGNAAITATQIDNGSNDNCGIATMTVSPYAFDCSNVGANAVVLTVTDVNGNITTCNATVTIEDNIAPIAICQNITVQLDNNGAASIVPADIDNGSNDACGVATLAISQSTFDCSNVGANTVVLTVTDNNGNVSTCNSTVTVEDNIAPIVSGCPTNITINNLANNCFQTVLYTPPTFSDNCGIDTFYYSNNSGVVCYQAACCVDKVQGAFPVGTTTITYTVIDVNGNISTCTFDITVVDTEPPSLNNCPVNITLNNDAGTCQKQFVYWTPPTPSDNCPSWNMTASHFPGQTFPVGTTTVTYVLADNAGHTVNCSFDVIIVDNEAPIAICQNNTFNLDASGNVVITANDINNGSTDNCGIQSLTLSQYNFDCSQTGQNTVTLTVLDIHGNTSTCQSTVTIVDNISPTVITQAATVYLDANGAASITTNDVDNGSYDNCSFTLGVAPSTFDCSNVGANTVVLTSTDASGNITTATAVITVIDNISPTVLTQNTTVYLDANGAATITTADVNNGSYDNCSFTLGVLPNTFDCSNVGANTVTLTATDASGNVSTLTAVVTVVDAIAPTVITQAITVYLDANGVATITANDVNNGSYDNCSYTLSVAPSAFDCGNVGANTVVLTSTDASGNITTATAVVTVVDNISPTVITQAVTVYLDANGAASITTNDVDNGSYDNCSFTLGVAPNTFDCSNVGANTVVLTSTDASGNITTATAVITVIDNISPTVLTQNTTVYLDANGAATITTADVNNGSYDNCSFTLGVLPNTFDCSNVGANTVTLTATDASGNVSTLTAVVTVVDAIAPTVLTQNLTLYLDANGMATTTAAQVDNGSFDNCSIATVTLSQTTFDCSNLGTNTVVLTVTDVNSNVSTANATITVIDNIDPIISGCPADITINAISTTCSNTAIWTPPTASDNCSISTLTSNYNSGDVFPLGATTVVYTATDVSGNTTLCSFTVYVIATPLVISNTVSMYNGNNISCTGAADGSIDVTLTGGCLPYTYNWSNGDVTEDLTGLSAGIYSLTAMDANGAVISLTVVLTEPEELVANVISGTYNGGWNISCNGLSDGNADLTITGGTASYTYLWSNGTTTEDLAGLAAGTYNVTVTDANGCNVVASITLTEPDVLAASLVSQTYIGGNNVSCNGSTDGSVDLTTIGGTNPYVFAWSNGVNTEDISQIGAGVYSVIVTDDNNCKATASITLTEPAILIADAGAATDVCVGNSTQIGASPTAIGGVGPYTYAWSNGGSLDYSNIPNPTATPGNTTTYTLNVNDQNGCMATSAVVITVNTLPLVSISASSPDDFCSELILTANSSSTVADYYWSTGETNQSISLSANVNSAGTYSVTITDDNGCVSDLGADYSYQPEGLANTYTIVAHYDLNLGERNYVESGSVGLTGVGKKAKIMKYAEINGPNAFLKADYIDAHAGSIVPIKIYDPAVVALPTMQYYTSSSISGTINIPNNTTVTLTTNYKNIKIGRNCNVTLSGTDFGDIEMEKSSTLTFTSASINIKKLKTKKAYSTAPSEINFVQNTKVMVKEEVRIEDNTIVNGAQVYNVVFYIGEDCQAVVTPHHNSGGGDSNCDPCKYSKKGKFHVHAKGVTFNASVMVPRGDIHVHKSASLTNPGYMTGLFVANKFKSEGKYVHWNWNNCNQTSTPVVAKSQITETSLEETSEVQLTVYPNPVNTIATVEFSVPVEGQVVVEIYNLVGQKVKTLYDNSILENETYKLKLDGNDYEMGVYYVRLTTGNESYSKKVVFVR